MPREKVIKVYQFDELSEKAKERAINWWLEASIGDEWWEATYEDANRARLQITSFDLDRHEINGDFMERAEDTAAAIIRDHGKDTETYKTASKYIEDRKALEEKYETDDPCNVPHASELNHGEEQRDLDQDFLKSILEDYRVMLQKEYEYVNSREYIEDAIRSNEYEFTENGKLA